MTRITKQEAHRLMCEADRDRARIVYGYPDGLTEAQERAYMERARQTPEYQEAEARFRKYSDMVDNAGPAALGRLL